MRDINGSFANIASTGTEKPGSKQTNELQASVDLSPTHNQVPALPDVDEIAGGSAQIRFLKEFTDRVATSDSTVLITGETGTGKELFARRIHRASQRRSRPLISVNCAAIPDTLLESELFGFERGAFTGALSHQDGMFVQANGGTLFLDEIGDLSLCAQAKLLRVVEQKEVRPLGSRTPRRVDVRIVAATNRNLQQLVADNTFRQDLFFRLNVLHIHVPPLRERLDDVPAIAAHFLRALCIQCQRPVAHLTAGAQRYLAQQPWVGNARELRSVMERALLLSNSVSITEKDVADMCHFGARWREAFETETPLPVETGPKNSPEYRKTSSSLRPHHVRSSERLEREQLLTALKETKWNKSRAAEFLQCSRMTIYRKVREYELSAPPASRSTTC